ncbi:MAG: hypothetical protein JSV33_00250 [bacterium]|nr:MAG: hypothetical protein JSV33_00250 [bacterium]
MKAISISMTVAMVVLLVGCSDTGGPSRKLSMRIDPAQCSISMDDEIILAAKIVSAKKLFAASFDIEFDNDIIDVEDVTVPASCILGSDCTICSFNETEHGISVGIGRIQTPEDDNVSGSGTLVEIHIRAKANGSTTVSFQNVHIIDEAGNPIPRMEKLQTKHATVTVQ